MSGYLATSPQVLAFLLQAKESPEDDAPRLVLADYLEDHGDPARAEFIRIQCRLAPGAAPLEPAALKRMEDRAEKLLALHGGAWLGSLWQWWLWPLGWHRGMLSCGLGRRIEADEVADVLPWLDNLFLPVTGRNSLLRVVRVMSQTQVNHLSLDVRQPVRESTLLSLLGQVRDSECLRTLSLDWPLSLLRHPPEGEQEASATPAVSDGFLRSLLDLPLAEHLTHLGSSPGWSPLQEALIGDLGVQPEVAQPRLWAHRLSACRFAHPSPDSQPR